jgi:hypothetical protein
VKAAMFVNNIAPSREMLAKQQIKMEITFLGTKNCTDTRSETGAFRTHDLLCNGVGPPPLGQRVFCCQCPTERVDDHLRIVIHVIITASHHQPTCVLVLLFQRYRSGATSQPHLTQHPHADEKQRYLFTAIWTLAKGEGMFPRATRRAELESTNASFGIATGVDPTLNFLDD